MHIYTSDSLPGETPNNDITNRQSITVTHDIQTETQNPHEEEEATAKNERGKKDMQCGTSSLLDWSTVHVCTGSTSAAPTATYVR